MRIHVDSSGRLSNEEPEDKAKSTPHPEKEWDTLGSKYFPHEYIPEDVKISAPSQGIPVYLEDRTVIGQATIDPDGRHFTVQFDDKYPVAELMGENLVGLSLINLGADRTENILNKEKEKTDD